MTLTEKLRYAADVKSGGVTFNSEYIDYSVLVERAERAARFLIERGVRPGDRVGIILPTCPEFHHAFFGTIMAGAIPAPLYPPLRLGRLDEYHEKTAQMLRTIDARLVITDNRVLKILGETLKLAQPALGWLTDLQQDAKADLPVVREDDIAFVQFSSGTTRAPKPVPLTHRQIASNIDAMIAAVRTAYPTADHSAMSWLPLYHDMGLIGCLLGSMFYPGNITLLSPEKFIADPAQWLRMLSESRATMSPAPNFAYALCLDRVRDEDIEGIDLSNWLIAMNGAEPVAPTVIERFIERFSKYGLRPEAMTPVYGLAEATLGVTFPPLNARHATTAFDGLALARDGVALPAKADDKSIRLVNLGQTLPSVSLQISGPADEPLPDGKLGRILLRGDSVTSGYLNGPRRENDAWLDTGDTGFMHDGGLYIYGRTKDILVVRGRKYPPHDVEHALSDLPGMRAGCVVAVGLPGKEGEELAVFAERGREGTIDENDLRARVLAATGLNVERVVILGPGTLPRTSSGKLSRSETVRRYLAGELRPPKKVGVVSLTLALLRSRFALRGAAR